VKRPLAVRKKSLRILLDSYVFFVEVIDGKYSNIVAASP
jgi:hypothetical protein